MIREEQLADEIRRNETILQVFDMEDLYQEWYMRKQNAPQIHYSSAARTAANFISPIRDSVTAIRICKDLGMFGQYVVKTVGDKQYVIFKGYAGVREIFTAPRYLETNQKVVQMAIGKVGLKSSIRIGGMLTIVLYAGIELIKYVLDESTLSQLVATMATDFIKVGLGCLASQAATLMIGTTATVAAGPLVVAIIIGIGVSLTLDYIDKKFGLTAKLAQELAAFGDAFDRKKDAMEKSLGRKIHEFERELIYRISHFDIDHPLGLAR